MKSTIFSVALASALVAIGNLEAAIYMTPSGATVAGGSVNAEADITPLSGQVRIVLRNLEANPKADTQLISGIIFDVSSLTGSGNLTTVNSGDISYLKKDYTYTAGVTDTLTRWTANQTGASILLTTFSGGKPTRQIIGPDDQGGFDPAIGRYSNANSSIDQHDPFVLGSATFTITVPGVTPSSEFDNVRFEFGTAAGANLVTAVPEPSTYLTGLGALAMLGLFSRRNRK